MSFIFPKPTDWNAFEDIVCDVFARKHQNMNLQRYGRSGQRQHGIDIAGMTGQGPLGVQCKHHPKGDISTDAIDAEVEKSEGFTPKLTEYVIATSAERDVKSHSYVLNLSQERAAASHYPVTIKYWDDICSWLSEYPDLVYKHFTKFYPHRDLEHLRLSAFESSQKSSISWPCTQDALITHVSASLGALRKTEPYQLSLSFTTFDTAVPVGKVDVDLSLTNFLDPHEIPDDAFNKASDLLKQFKAIILAPFFSTRLLVYPQARLSYALLFGWTFRKVTGFELLVAVGQEIWPSEGLFLTPTMLTDDLPLIRDGQSDEVVLILNISRDIKASVIEYVKSWDEQPKAVVSYQLDGRSVTSAAHALSLALDISRKIKNLGDSWGARRIHLFGALPAALAMLIGHHLNAICPLNIYFLGDDRKSYQLGGVITNSL